MEPPAVTSSIGNQHVHAHKRDHPMPFLSTLDSQINFGSTNRHFEDLPENFLETISPQQSGPSQSSLNNNATGRSHHDPNSHTAPQLASLTTMNAMSLAGVDNERYVNLVPIHTPHYITSLKMESLDHMNHSSALHPPNALQKSSLRLGFGNGTADLLSPLHLDGQGTMGLFGTLSRPNASRPSNMLSELRQNNVSYIKEEVGPDINYQAHEYEGYTMPHPSAQELERMANAETPPALSSNIEIASSMLALSSRNTPSPQTVHAHSRQTHQNQHHYLVHHQVADEQHTISQHHPTRSNRTTRSKTTHMQSIATDENSAHAYYLNGPIGNTDGAPRTYSTTDMTDPLNAEIEDDIYIDTKDLCKRVAYELKQHSIPQAIFAERILCRSQGTLSDLLRNPKPWNRLKSGRETFRRMYNWLQQELNIRLSILDMYKGPMGSANIPPPTPAQNSRHHHRTRRASTDDDSGNGQKRPRLVFSDIQKRTLQAIFKETQRPSREMQQTIAEHLRLDISTVSNFFMNARRRSRNGTGLADEPTAYQQIQTITPPPESPQQHHQQAYVEKPIAAEKLPRGRSSKANSQGNHHPHASSANMNHIEQTVEEVIGQSIAYAKQAKGVTATHSIEDSINDTSSNQSQTDELLGDQVDEIQSDQIGEQNESGNAEELNESPEQLISNVLAGQEPLIVNITTIATVLQSEKEKEQQQLFEVKIEEQENGSPSLLSHSTTPPPWTTTAGEDMNTSEASTSLLHHANDQVTESFDDFDSAFDQADYNLQLLANGIIAEMQTADNSTTVSIRDEFASTANDKTSSNNGEKSSIVGTQNLEATTKRMDESQEPNGDLVDIENEDLS